jgi:AraC-like DNA-binding protein
MSPSATSRLIEPSGRWTDPYTDEGLRLADAEAELTAPFEVHEVGSCRFAHAWDYRQVSSPFWRLYHNSKAGWQVRVGRKVCELTPGQVWLIPAGVTFDCAGEPGIPHLWIHFSPGLGSIDDWPEPRAIAMNAELKALLQALRRQVETGGASGATRHRALALLHAAFADAGEGSGRTLEPRLRTVLLAIDRSLAMPPTVEDLSLLAHLSPSRFARWFREAVGNTPAVYVQKRRVAEAARQLAFTSATVDQVAEALGFANRFHFSRVFKRVLGEAPGTFKRRRGPR